MKIFEVFDLHRNCRKEHSKEITRLLGELQEKQAIFDYTVFEKEKRIKELEDKIITLANEHKLHEEVVPKSSIKITWDPNFIPDDIGTQYDPNDLPKKKNNKKKKRK